MLETTEKERKRALAKVSPPTSKRMLVCRALRDVDKLMELLDRRAGAAHDFAVALGDKGVVVGHEGGFGNCPNQHCAEAVAILGE